MIPVKYVVCFVPVVVESCHAAEQWCQFSPYCRKMSVWRYSAEISRQRLSHLPGIFVDPRVWRKLLNGNVTERTVDNLILKRVDENQHPFLQPWEVSKSGSRELIDHHFACNIVYQPGRLLLISRRNDYDLSRASACCCNPRGLPLNSMEPHAWSCSQKVDRCHARALTHTLEVKLRCFNKSFGVH